MFVVAITLGLLAAMGVYGLTATAADIRSSGHLRDAMHGRSAGEHALVTTAETLHPGNAGFLVSQMTTGGSGQAQDCRTAAPFTGAITTRDAEACLRLDATKMKSIANANGNVLWPVATPAFAADGFGPLSPPPPNAPITKVELTNPVDVLGIDGKSAYKRVTMTVFVEMRNTAAPYNSPAETVMAGRGRLTIGPIGTAGTGGGRIANFD